MIFELINRPLVYTDVISATQYYLKISHSLADEFLLQLDDANDFITENPLAVDVMYLNVRMHKLEQFPYHIHYIIDDVNSQIVVLAVAFAKMGNLDFTDRL